ncbi:HAMP domain-containing histidine kinase [Roseiconus nitratireducens]|uniref:histidine kinase n=2 Tax=Roseiconus nitratireducens TaxID=2605748 RepID=A0A5M6D5B1_9BACT|nr:HAMP domain-containing histidine kinase [Roseiconus nitratireducens]
MAAVAVALGSSWWGASWASEQMQDRFVGIRDTLSGSTFPLNAVVLNLLADLTQTELATVNANGQLLQATVIPPPNEPLAANLARTLGRESGGRDEHTQPAGLTVGSRRYRVYFFSMNDAPVRSDGVAGVAVLFDEALLRASRRRAALLPLVTGLSTIAAISSVALVLSSRLVGRLAKLQHRVEAVADGDFDSTVSDDVGDEVGRLGGAVDSMANQLSRLWGRVNRQQSEKLLHQIAGGMAHQLRNSLTGARMAVELHAADCPHADDEGLQVAISQIESAESYVRRLLLVASGRQDQNRPMSAMVCWNDVRLSLTPIARHLRVEIRWQDDGSLSRYQIGDGPTWVAALTNLVHNAMQAGDQVWVDAEATSDAGGPPQLRVRVADNGPGIPEEVAEDLFEPLVTSKPEGLGLGLPVVRRAAEFLGGDVKWTRADGKTVFELMVTVTIQEET